MNRLARMRHDVNIEDMGFKHKTGLSAKEGTFSMDNHRDKLNREHLAYLAKRLEKIKKLPSQTGQLTEQERQLRQSIDIVNQLINENAHRPESIRLLRKILRERAEVQWVRRRDENSLSG